MIEIQNKPSILYVAHAYNNRAGVETHLKTLTAALKESYSCYLLFPENDHLILLKDGIEAQRFPARTFSILNPQSDANIEKILTSVIDTINPSLVHIMHFLGWPLRAFELIHEKKIPFVISLHDYYAVTPLFTLQDQKIEETLSSEYSIKHFGKDISPFLKERRAFLQSAFGYAKKIVVPSEFLHSMMATIFPGNYQIIPYGINAFSPLEAKDSADLRLGYLGSLIPQKGWRTLLSAFEEVYKENKKVTLHVFGSGNEAIPSIEAVHFHGAYDQSDLASITSQFDIGIIPSEFPETYSIVLSELWYAQKPVIASDIGALAERIIDKENGRLFKAGNYKDLKRVILDEIRTSAWKKWKIPKPYMAEEMKAEFNKLYSDIIAERSFF